MQTPCCAKRAKLPVRAALAEYVAATQYLSVGPARVRDLDEARRLVSEALQLAFAAGWDGYAASTKAALAEDEFAAGNVEKALQLAKESAEVFRGRKDWLRLSFVLSSMSAYFLALKRYAEAQSCAREALQRAHAVGQTSLCWALQHLAVIAILNGLADSSDQPVQRAAKILGYVDACLKQKGLRRYYYTEEEEYRKALSALREMLEEDEMVKLMEDGTQWSEDRAVAEALEMCGPYSKDVEASAVD